jgi:hypothetical protein
LNEGEGETGVLISFVSSGFLLLSSTGYPTNLPSFPSTKRFHPVVHSRLGANATLTVSLGSVVAVDDDEVGGVLSLAVEPVGEDLDGSGRVTLLSVEGGAAVRARGKGSARRKGRKKRETTTNE